MGRDQNLRETSMNVNSHFTIFGSREIHDCQFSLFFVILSEILANVCHISCENAKMRGIGHEQDFTIWTETKRDFVKC